MVAPLVPSPFTGELDAFTTIFLWQFKPEWRVILPLPDDEEDVEFEPQQLVRCSSIDKQPIMVDKRINNSNQFSSSPVVSHMNLSLSIKGSIVQSPISVENPFKNDHIHFFIQPENQDGNNAIQTYELITIGQDTVLMVIGKQKDLITTVCKDKDLRFDFDFSFSVSVLGRSSCFTLVTFPLVSFVPSMKEIVNTTSTTSPQNLVTLFDPGRYLNLQES